MMNLEYRKATIDDLDLLTKTRIEVLRAANNLDNLIDMSRVERESRVYYENAIANNFHTAYLVFDGVDFVGTGGISYYTVMPTFHNPTGKKAYIMNMYTKPDHRRIGIATRTLELLIQDAKQHGITSVSLEATDIGRKLYESYGFVSMTSEMEFLIV